MEGNKLYYTRTLPCINELYLESECVNGGSYDFETILMHSPKNEEGRSILPTGAFYIDKKKYDEIIEKHCKGLPYYWRFPYRSEIYPKGEEWEQLQIKYKNNPDDKEIKEEYEDTIEYMRRDKLWEEYRTRLQDIDEKRDRNEINAKEAKKQRDALAKKFECQRRSHERETISFAAAFWGPTYIKGYFDKVKLYYEGNAPEGIDYSLAKSDAEVFKRFESNIKNND